MNFFSKKIKLLLAATCIFAVGVFAPAPAHAGLWEDVTKGVGDFVGGVVDGGGKFIDAGGKLLGEMGQAITGISSEVLNGLGEVQKAIKAVTKFKVGDFEFDIADGIQGLQKQFYNHLPDEVVIPGTPFTLYPKEPPATNVIKNLVPMLSGAMGMIDPMKPIASLARGIIKIIRPVFDSVIKPLLPDFIKGGAQAAKDFIKNTLRSVDGPLMKNLILPVWDFFIGPLDDLVYDIIDIFAEELHINAPNFSSDGSGQRVRESEKIAFPDPVRNTTPVGEFMGINDRGNVSGWAIDNDTPNQSVWIDVVIDGVSHSASAGEQNPGSIAVPGNHGFSFSIPYRWRDGVQHSLSVKAFDTAFGIWTDVITLPGSPKNFTLSAPSVGYLDIIPDSAVVTGWAIDPDVKGGTEVEFYLDNTRDAGGVYLGAVKTNIKSEFPDYWLKEKGVPDGLIGFSFQIDKTKISGGRHKVYAYAKDFNAMNGVVNLIELDGSPKSFRTAEIFALQFSENPYKVSAGQWVSQIVKGLPGEVSYKLSAELDGVEIDLNEHHRFMYANPWDVGKVIYTGGYGSARVLADFELKFRVPKNVLPGKHMVTLKIDAPYSIIIPAEFALDVVDLAPIKVTAADSMTAGGETDIVIQNFPRFVSFSGKDANTSVSEIYIVAKPEFSWGIAPRVNLTDLNVISLPDGSVKVHAKIPSTAGSLRKDNGPVELYVVLLANTKTSQDAFLVSYPYHIIARGVTAEGTDPLLVLACASSRKAEIGASARGYGIDISGSNFACYSTLSVSISGTTLGKPFTEKAMNVTVNEYGESIGLPDPAPTTRAYRWKTGWDGSVSIEIMFGPDWVLKYSDVESLTVTVTDSEGNSATAIANLDVSMRVLPPEGQTEIFPGDAIRIWLKNSTVGLRVEIGVDGTILKRPMLERKGVEIIEGVYLPTDIKPGEHVLTLSGKPMKFLVSERKQNPKDEKKIDSEKIEQNKKPEIVLDPKISVLPQTAKPGMKISLQLSGFHPLAGMTIYLKGQGRAEKLSGYADFTDSSGSLTKEATLKDNLPAGAYTVEATDIEGLKAQTTLTISLPIIVEPSKTEVAPEPTPKPELEPVPIPQPEPESKPKPVEDPELPPTCPNGFTYSPTFKQCIEDAPVEDSPYAGKPCSDLIPMYQQKGCIP